MHYPDKEQQFKATLASQSRYTTETKTKKGANIANPLLPSSGDTR